MQLCALTTRGQIPQQTRISVLPNTGYVTGVLNNSKAEDTHDTKPSGPSVQQDQYMDTHMDMHNKTACITSGQNNNKAHIASL
jgi:hypothetical protein